MAAEESKSSATVVTVVEDDALLEVVTLETTAYEGQKPGTSGLRKKTKVWMDGTYTHNFVTAVFRALDASELAGSTIVVSGDGRYYSPEAIQIIIKIAASYGVARVWVGQNGLLSTPAVSAVIRNRERGVAVGGLILTASHNPGGPTEDFGIKYNISTGGPAPDDLTTAMYDITKTLTSFTICPNVPDVDLSKLGRTVIGASKKFEVEVIDSCEDLVALYRTVFDIEKIAAFVQRSNFSFTFDALSGVGGVYAQRVFVELLGAAADSLSNCTPLPDFGGGHPDPNLTYAHDLVEAMGLTSAGVAAEGAEDSKVPDFGAAADGDADRNMILGRKFFVTPSDSVAIIAANATAIPFFRDGLKGVARSMPTSMALDRVAEKLSLRCFEVPTGWKYFGNLMDSTGEGKVYTPFLCGEESFGTGSNHIREKDGLWAVLAWLSILADRNAEVADGAKLVSVRDIVVDHWSKYGRNYYSRYDYENVESAGADSVMEYLRGKIAEFTADGAEPAVIAGLTVSGASEFNYTDPVDGSEAKQQGLRFFFTDGSRLVFRLSGTGSVGATIRMYLERHEPDSSKLGMNVADALAPVVAAALELAKIEEFTGRSAPSVIT